MNTCYVKNNNPWHYIGKHFLKKKKKKLSEKYKWRDKILLRKLYLKIVMGKCDL